MVKVIPGTACVQNRRCHRPHAAGFAGMKNELVVSWTSKERLGGQPQSHESEAEAVTETPRNMRCQEHGTHTW